MQASSLKHLGVTLDVKLVCDEHLINVLNKANKTIRLLRRLQNILYDQTCNSSFHEKLESIQYNVCVVLTGATRVFLKEKIYQELDMVRFIISQ